jgi:hypothetical protein
MKLALVHFLSPCHSTHARARECSLQSLSRSLHRIRATRSHTLATAVLRASPPSTHSLPDLLPTQRSSLSPRRPSPESRVTRVSHPPIQKTSTQSNQSKPPPQGGKSVFCMSSIREHHSASAAADPFLASPRSPTTTGPSPTLSHTCLGFRV